jgi:hypothetical protein
MDVAPTLASLNAHLNARLNGNRAPMGLFNHAGWFSSNPSIINPWI